MKGMVNRLSVPVATLLAGLVIGGVGTSFAAGSFQGFPTANVTLYGRPITSDVPAIVVAGRTMLPVRAIAEALNLDVSWDQATSTVVLTAKPTTTSTTPAKGEPVTFGNLKAMMSQGQSYTSVIGEVTNNSSTAVSGIVAITFFDANGKLLGRATGAFHTVQPGQSKSFEALCESVITEFTTMKAEAQSINKG